MAEIVLSLFGSFEAHMSSGRALVFATRKTKALFAYLALHEGSAVHREALRVLLWSDRDVEHGRNSVRQALKALHASLGDPAAIVSDRNTVTLPSGTVDLDVDHFLRGLRSDDLAAVETAADIYQGDLLDDLDISDPAFKAWRTREAGELRSALIEGLERLLNHYRDGSPSRAVEIARRIAAVDPCHEPSHCLLIAHHRARGNVTAAAEQYERLQHALRAIGASPSAEADRLYRAGTRDQALERIAHPSGQDRSPSEAPSIAVLPFAVQGEDDTYGYFADGVAEDILTALSHMPWLRVIARGSTFAYRGGIDIGEVSRELDVRYVLQGSLRRSGDKVRIGGRLSDAVTGSIIWADRFDSELQNVFDSQDRVTEAVLGAIAPGIEAAEIERAKAKRPEDLDAWDLYLQALPFHYEMTADGHEQAMRLLRASLERDPRFAPALGVATWAYTLRVPQQWGDNADNVATGLDFARRAIAAAHDDADALAMGGYGLAFLARDLDGGQRAVDRSIMLNSNAARAFTFSGWVRGYAGDHETAIAHYRRALHLSPRDQIGFRTRGGLAFSLLFTGRLEEALSEAQRAYLEGPYYVPAYRVLVATLAHLGQFDEAQEVVRRLRTLTPNLTTSYAIAECRYTRPEDLQCLREGFLRAGLPA